MVDWWQYSHSDNSGHQSPGKVVVVPVVLYAHILFSIPFINIWYNTGYITICFFATPKAGPHPQNLEHTTSIHSTNLIILSCFDIICAGGVLNPGALENVEIDFFKFDFRNCVCNITLLLLNHVVLRNRGCLETTRAQKIKIWPSYDSFSLHLIFF